MTDAVLYREKAAGLHRQAAEAITAYIREEFIRLAEQYENMAAAAEGWPGRE